ASRMRLAHGANGPDCPRPPAPDRYPWRTVEQLQWYGWVLVGADLGLHYLPDVMNRRRNRPCLRTLATIESRCMSQIARSIATVAPPAFEAA
ncbi:hypothetical protein, partial [Stenotrophomonas indicatrix]|uniref:hypothetical protein n=1 Tax=Stenotrophomonas indicatrix TaxID=2045451 RepID=UPI0039EF73E0